MQSLHHFNSKHPLVLKILEWLYLIHRRGRTVSFCWVPAHVGIFGNEEADRLAKEAALLPVPRRCSIPFSDFIPAITKEIKSVWQFRWDLVGPNKMKEFAASINPWHYPTLPRRYETALCRLRIGHTRLSHGYLMDGDPSPYCDDCLVPLTVKHILVECPSLLDCRRRYLLPCFDEHGCCQLVRVVGEECDIQGLFKFLEAAGILHDI